MVKYLLRYACYRQTNVFNLVIYIVLENFFAILVVNLDALMLYFEQHVNAVMQVVILSNNSFDLEGNVKY